MSHPGSFGMQPNDNHQGKDQILEIPGKSFESEADSSDINSRFPPDCPLFLHNSIMVLAKHKSVLPIAGIPE